MIRSVVIGGMIFGALLALPAVNARAADNPPNNLQQMILRLLANSDRQFRAAGLDQIRSGAKGEEATRLFAAQLSKLDVAAQVDLLSALADRDDAAARPAVLDLLASTQDEKVRAAAILALGALGKPSDLPQLIKALASKSGAEQAAAKRSLILLNGAEVSSVLASELNSASPSVKAALIEALAQRRAKDAVPAFLAATTDDNGQVRSAAMAALGQVGTPNQISAMLPGVLKAQKGGERDAAEKNVALVCSRVENENQRAEVLIKALETVDAGQRDQLLSLVGRVGGKRLIKFVADIATSSDPAQRKLGVDALSKWPDASVADTLLKIANEAKDPAERAQAFQGYVKIGATRDRRSDRQRLDRMKQAMKAARSPEEQSLVLNRSRTAYDVDTLRFVLPYVDQPQFAQIACETIVELAHHREIRDPNKAEFDKALDKVIATSKNKIVVERANRYKRGETWSRQ